MAGWLKHLIKVLISRARLLALGSVFTACVPQAFMETDFKSHLTPLEKQELKAGRTVEKQHRSYWRFKPSQLYYEGPLRVAMQPNGKLKFTQYGHWQQFKKNGDLLADSRIDSSGYGYGRIYPRAGCIGNVWLDRKGTLDGESLKEHVIVSFRNCNEADTALVQHWYFRGDVFVRELRSYDLAGRKPILKWSKF